MVEVTVEGDKILFHIQGLHKLWAFRSRLEIPRSHIRAVHQDKSVLQGSKGWRALGTHVPGLITAGTFYLEVKTIFWDVVDPEKAIVIELEDEDYHRLIVEVADPARTIQLLQN